jgi:hypothetical protein
MIPAMPSIGGRAAAKLTENRIVKQTKVSRTCSWCKPRKEVCTYPQLGVDQPWCIPKGDRGKDITRKMTTSVMISNLKQSLRDKQCNNLALLVSKLYYFIHVVRRPSWAYIIWQENPLPSLRGKGVNWRKIQWLAATQNAAVNRINHCDTV